MRQGSQAAFSALVARHLNFVYSVCLRETGDAALAEDVTQVVFLILARKAPALRPEPSLTGWLFQTARFAARNARRRASRRQEWEAQALAQTPAPGLDDLWDQIRPALNDALAALGAKDRQAVLLRFADGLSFPELGAALGTSEDAARMRLNRAVERLRHFFAKEGVTLSGLVLAGLLADRTVQAAPAACAAIVARIAESVPAGGGSSIISPQVHSQLQGVWKAMTISKLKVGATIGIGALLAGSLPFVTLAKPQKKATPLVPLKKVTKPSVDQSGAAVLAQAARATASLRSLSADVEGDGIIPPDKWAPVCKLTLKRPSQIRTESLGTYGQTSVVNGDKFMFYTHWNKEYQQELNPHLKEDKVGPPVFSTFFFNPGIYGMICEGLKPSAQTPVHLLGTKKWHGGSYTAVLLTYTAEQINQVDPGNRADPVFGKLTAYFGADHLLYGYTMDATYRGKRTVDEYALKNLRINPELSDAEFVFTPPADAQPSKPPTAHLHKTSD